jgi:hypothetical protein
MRFSLNGFSLFSSRRGAEKRERGRSSAVGTPGVLCGKPSMIRFVGLRKWGLLDSCVALSLLCCPSFQSPTVCRRAAEGTVIYIGVPRYFDRKTFRLIAENSAPKKCAAEGAMTERSTW